MKKKQNLCVFFRLRKVCAETRIHLFTSLSAVQGPGGLTALLLGDVCFHVLADICICDADYHI